MSENLYKLVRDVPDFPKPGILFRDITPILLDPRALAESIRALAQPLAGLGATKVAAIESRGFILGAPVALALEVGMAIIRKPGKLPADCHRFDYSLEYGTDSLEMHTDAVGPDDRVIVIDDVLATGGTAAAAGELIGKSGARLAGYGFLIELAGLGGKAKLGDVPVHSVLKY
jgi:adenine phosphoribosyltransferase